MDNPKRKGFRWSRANTGHPTPPMEECVVEATYQAVADSEDVDLHIGDPVKRTSGGNVELADEGDDLYGIIMGFRPYWDGQKLVPTNFLPGGTDWGTLWYRRSIALVTPVRAGIWEIDVDENTTADSVEDYHALIGENADHAFYPVVAERRGNPMLKISTHSTSDGQWRIYGISDTQNNIDFTGENVKLLVTANEVQEGV